MNDREEVALRVLMNQAPSKMTRVQLDKIRRADMVAANTQKFGSQTIGIHGGELPKFSEARESKTWWHYQQDRKQNPLVQSATVLKQSQKFWAKNDLILLGDKTNEGAPKDQLKTSMYKKQPAKEAVPKVTSLVHCADEDLKTEPSAKFGYKNKVLWSTLENEKRVFGTDRIFDKIIQQGEAYEADVLLRKRKLQEYFAKPQRGTQRSKFNGKETSMYNYDIPINQKNRKSSQRYAELQVPQQAAHNNQNSVSVTDATGSVSTVLI